MSGAKKVREIRNVDERKEHLMERVRAEYDQAAGWSLPLELDLHSALCLVGNLQLALRHPGNTGPSAGVARRIVDGIISRFESTGYPAHAELARLGDNSAYDD